MRVLDFSDGFTSVGAPSAAGAWTAPDGTVSAPGIAFGSDLNNGFYRSATDTWHAVSAGVSRITIGPTGKISLGTASDASVAAGGFAVQDRIAAGLGSLGTPTLHSYDDADSGINIQGSNVIQLVTGGVSKLQGDTTGIRVRTTAASYETLERLSVLHNPVSGDAASNQAAMSVSAYNALDVAFSARQTGVYATFHRITTTDITDSGGPCVGLRAATIFSIGSGVTYTNSGIVAAVLIPQPSQAGPGSIAITDYAGIYLQSSSLNTGTRKYGIYLGEQTGATNNAAIADNTSLSGTWFINSTSTAASLFSGIVRFAAGLRTIVSTANTANPPTDAELDSAFGAPATLGTGFIGILNDNNGGTNEYLCWADGTNWFYATGTKAA